MRLCICSIIANVQNMWFNKRRALFNIRRASLYWNSAIMDMVKKNTLKKILKYTCATFVCMIFTSRMLCEFLGYKEQATNIGAIGIFSIGIMLLVVKMQDIVNPPEDDK